MTLVENWKQCWRWFSMQALAVLAVLPIVWTTLPPEAQAWMPVEYRPWIVLALAVGGIVGRLVNQTKADAQ